MNGRGTLVALLVAAPLAACGSSKATPRAQSDAGPAECVPPAPNEPMLVTDGCVDPRFNRPYVDIDEMRSMPVVLRYVHGGFTGTDARFSFYFPPADQYKGRFFQNTHQLLTSEDSAADATIGFAIASGGYYVQTNIGGSERAQTPEQAVNPNIVPAVGGYRVNAAAAKYGREQAHKIYGDDRRIYGYLYGGSGGAYQTICSSEHTTGLWDGYVAIVMGTPNAIPGVFTVRVHALRVLNQRNKFPGILDAIDPGGSGDPYAGLNDEEAGALHEATRMGFPPRGWWNYSTLNGGALGLVAGYVPLLDPTYSNDFWTLPGYLGHDDTTGSLAAARIQDKPGARKVSAVMGLPASIASGITLGLGEITLDSMPPGDMTGADVFVDVGGGQTQQGLIFLAMGNTLITSGLDFASIKPGMSARIDNSDFLALQTYHRHNLPTTDMYGWNSLRGPDGQPLYPQRKVLIGPIGAFNGAGCITSGNFNGKMIVVENLMDIDAIPWQADWYRTKVKEALGPDFESRYRLYFTDYAQHTSPTLSGLGSAGPSAFARTIVYDGVFEHALRDLSAWVEDGIAAPTSTSYQIDGDSQVQVPMQARGGIQPVVELKVNGGDRADIGVGTSVDFTVSTDTPQGTGTVVQAEWDFEGVGTFPATNQVGTQQSSAPPTGVSTGRLQASYTFNKAGTYFPVVRITAQREGDPNDPYARVQNLGRVRVVVN
jgi:hypothetical protein